MPAVVCVSCGLKIANPTYVRDLDNLVPFCSKCLYKKACVFCDPPVINEHCSVEHSIGAKRGNRFREDEDFVLGARFEMD